MRRTDPRAVCALLLALLTLFYGCAAAEETTCAHRELDEIQGEDYTPVSEKEHEKYSWVDYCCSDCGKHFLRTQEVRVNEKHTFENGVCTKCELKQGKVPVTPTPVPESEATPAPTVRTEIPGELYASVEVDVSSLDGTFKFGAYEQDGNPDNGLEPIEWVILWRRGSTVLAVSRYILDAQPYNGDSGEISWAKSSIREWLNDEFLNAAFNEEERPYVLNMKHDNSRNASYNTHSGPDTYDQVFLLSANEVEKYLAKDTTRITAPTRYALSRGAWESPRGDYRGYGIWWLRTAGSSRSNAATVGENGHLHYSGADAAQNNLGIRPAIYINFHYFD